MNQNLKYHSYYDGETSADFFLRLISEDEDKSRSISSRKQSFGGSLLFGNNANSDLYMPTIVPFSFDGIWFGVGIDYFEMAFSANKIYQYPYFERTLIKGMTIFNNQFLPVVNYIGALGMQSDVSPSIMMLLSDTNRNIVIEADRILRPEKFPFGSEKTPELHNDLHSVVLSQVRIQDRNTILLNTNELIKLADLEA